MAVPRINIYVDMEMNMFTDLQRRTPFPGPLFQRAGDSLTYYIDENLSVEVRLLQLEELATTADMSYVMNAEDSCPSTSTNPTNESFSRDHTLFLIDLMRGHLIENEGLPKSLAELNARLKTAKGNKKLLWRDFSLKLEQQFKEVFCPDRVARKWCTLVEGYKKVKDNNKSTGKGAMRFQFYGEMDALLGAQHDIDFPVVAGVGGVEVRRPEVLASHNNIQAEGKEPETTPVKSPITPSTRRKRKRQDEDVLDLLNRSIDMCQTNQTQMLEQMRSAQAGFESLMTRLLDKF